MRQRRLPLIASVLATVLMLATLCPCLGPSPDEAQGTERHSCCAPEVGLQAASPSCCSMTIAQDDLPATITAGPGLALPVTVVDVPLATLDAVRAVPAGVALSRPPLLVPLRI